MTLTAEGFTWHEFVFNCDGCDRKVAWVKVQTFGPLRSAVSEITGELYCRECRRKESYGAGSASDVGADRVGDAESVAPPL